MRFFTKIQDQIADKIDHLINASGKMDVKMSSVVKQPMYVLKLFQVTTGSFTLFRFVQCSIEMLRIMYPKYLVWDNYDSRNPPLLWIIWISNPFLDFNKEVKYPFSYQKSGLDFSKEAHPKFREE